MNDEKLKNKSIELGFKGELTDEFYDKLHKVKKVRRRLKLELLGFVCCCAMFLYVTQAITSGVIAGVALIFFFLSFAIALRILWVFNDIHRVKRARHIEYLIETIEKSERDGKQ